MTAAPSSLSFLSYGTWERNLAVIYWDKGYPRAFDVAKECVQPDAYLPFYHFSFSGLPPASCLIFDVIVPLLLFRGEERGPRGQVEKGLPNSSRPSISQVLLVEHLCKLLLTAVAESNLARQTKPSGETSSTACHVINIPYVCSDHNTCA